jgi:hypothetical protein
MIYRGRVLITDEAVEVYKKISLYSTWKVKASWDSESQLLIVDCDPSDVSFNWSWQEINKVLNLDKDVVPSSASEVRDRDAIALIFRSDIETDLCKPLLSNGDIYEIGNLTSSGFSKNL